jgi:hypothetical protein
MIATAPRPVLQGTIPAPRCPRDGQPLFNGPILFECGTCGSSVRAADLSREVSR